MTNITNAWVKTLEYFQKNHSDDYQLWIMYLNFVQYQKRNKTLILSVSNPITKDTIVERYSQKVADIFAEFYGEDQVYVQIQISEDQNIFEDQKTTNNNKAKEKKAYHKNTKALVSNKNYIVDLNPKFTFDRFVTGPNSELAYSASIFIAQNPGKEYNPFFIYGGVGLGKTHLMQAIGNFVLKNRSDLSVIYATVENYLNDYIVALQNRKLNNFRAKYREADVLLLDDIQFLEKKEQTQEELFHTFNKLYQDNKQIVFTCDKPPKELKMIQERLITRFSWGLVTDIKQPGLEIRKAIVTKKLEELNLSQYVDQDMIDFLAENITTNIRDIESAILKIKSLVQLAGKTLSIEVLKNNLSDLLTPLRAQQRKINCENIQREVSSYYRINVSDLKSSKRTKEISFPRQMSMYLCKELLNLSFSEIGKAFGGRDHSTVVASCKKIEKEIKKNPSIRNDYEELLKVFSTF